MLLTLAEVRSFVLRTTVSMCEEWSPIQATNASDRGDLSEE